MTNTQQAPTTLYYYIIIGSGECEGNSESNETYCSVLLSFYAGYLYVNVVFGEGNDNPFQYSCLENPMDRGTWQATVHVVPKESGTTY